MGKTKIVASLSIFLIAFPTLGQNLNAVECSTLTTSLLSYHMTERGLNSSGFECFDNGSILIHGIMDGPYPIVLSEQNYIITCKKLGLEPVDKKFTPRDIPSGIVASNWRSYLWPIGRALENVIGIYFDSELAHGYVTTAVLEDIYCSKD